MGLDLSETLQQISAMAQALSDGRDGRAQRLDAALTALRETDPSKAMGKAASDQGRPFLCAGLVDGLAGRYGSKEVPPDFCVASVDGSHIDVDRHIPLPCYLINLGGCLLTYGAHPDARLSSRPAIYSRDEDLYMASPVPGPMESVAVDGPLLGLKRAVEEVKGLVSLVLEAPPGLPALALIDGSLVLWGLAGRGYQPFVRDEFVAHGLVPALDRLREMSGSRPLAVAAYVSLPQATEVVNALRLNLCPKDGADCRQRCSSHRSGGSPCDMLNGFLDRHLFQELLGPGERSSLFFTNSSISRDFYGGHQVYFYYLNTGDEIARMELPQWVAMNSDLLELSHSLILDQIRRGLGYPAAIGEAHEQAVVTGRDREAFKQLLGGALNQYKLPVYTSEKNRSKQMRWL